MLKIEPMTTKFRMISVSEKDKMIDNFNYRRTPVCEIEHVNFAIKVMRDDL